MLDTVGGVSLLVVFCGGDATPCRKSYLITRDVIYIIKSHFGLTRRAETDLQIFKKCTSSGFAFQKVRIFLAHSNNQDYRIWHIRLGLERVPLWVLVGEEVLHYDM